MKTETSRIALSAQQEAVLDWAVNDTGSLVLVARAGTGKTFTLLATVRSLLTVDPSLEIVLMAFNKAIAEEIKEKVASKEFQAFMRDAGCTWKNLQVATVHSLGFGVWRRYAKDVVVEDKKVYQIIDQIAEELAPSTGVRHNTSEEIEARRNVESVAGFVRAAVNLAKQQGFGPLVDVDDYGAWLQMIDHFGLEDLLPENGNRMSMAEAVDLVKVVYEISLNCCRKVVDYADMILAPLAFVLRFWPKDVVMVDEAQDTNATRRALVLKMLRPKTWRLLAVGDDRQAIYGFTGADSDALDLIRDGLGARTLPLTCTYRCARRIVAEAQEYVPDIEAQDGAPEGVVRDLPYDGTGDEAQERVPDLFGEPLEAGDVILCRNNAPLMNLAYALLRQGRGCYVEGRDIGHGILALARRWKCIKMLPPLVDKLAEYKDREVQKWMAKGREEKAEAVEDKVDSLVAVAQAVMAKGGSTVQDLADEIEVMFKDTRPGETPRTVVLSTIHKSKGREWGRVYVLGFRQLLPSRWARKAWQLHQEDNLAYVAITRAERELVYVDLPPKNKEE